MKTKEVVIGLLLFFIPLCAFAQPDQIPVSIIKSRNKEQVKNYFNSDSVRLLRVGPKFDNKGLFILYEKADTLDFDDPFYKTDTPFNHLGSTSDDYILEGLAYYEKKGNVYQKRLANDNAFFCSSCENMGRHNIAIHGDTVMLSISWGPRQGWEGEYRFVYRPQIKRWQLIAGSSSGGFYGDYNNLYVEYAEKGRTFLDNIYTEDFLYGQPIKGVAHGIKLGFHPGKYSDLLHELKKIPKRNRNLLSKVFNAEDAKIITMDKNGNNNITLKNVVAASNVGYFLEQANELNAAGIILDSVIAKFPDHVVAWLNLGDVYRKMNKTHEALKAYQKYMAIMKQKGPENKIPKRVISFVKEK